MAEFLYLPEWEEQLGTVLIYPDKNSDWKCCFKDFEKSFLHFVNTILEFQKVFLIVNDDLEKQKFPPHRNLKIFNIKTNDTWARDIIGLPIFNQQKKLHLLNYQFNGWGNKFDASLDNLVTENLVKLGFLNNLDIINSKLIIEGGALETNGEILLVTKSSILNKNRNQENSLDEVEKSFYQFLGVKKIIWLENSFLEGDDTDGHIDMLARFVNKNTIFYAVEIIGQELKSKLKDFNFVKLPEISCCDIPRNYLNFIFVNKAILVPIYNLPEDKEALKIFQNYFPDLKVIGIDSSVFIKQGGSLHCLTMQIYK